LFPWARDWVFHRGRQWQRRLAAAPRQLFEKSSLRKRITALPNRLPSETRKDYTRAISEYAGAAVAAGGESPATGRLVELARRPKLRDLVNDATAKLAVDSHYALPAVNLRLRVLEAANRPPEMATFFSATLDHAETIEQAAAIEAIAQQRSLESVRQKALEKQAALATDPVTRIQLRYALVRFYESKKDFAAAQRNIEALYQANPKILGVVRCYKVTLRAVDRRVEHSRPSNLHLGAEHQLDSRAHLVVSQEFTAIELVQAFFYLLPEPYVMVNIVFDELPDVFLRAAVVVFRSPVNPRW
jgi:hypothetical protein